MSTFDLNKRALKGAKLLDEALPGWASKVDLGILNMSVGGACVLGQCFEGFTMGAHRLRMVMRWSNVDTVRYGFNLDFLSSPTNSKSDDWNELRDAWVPLIEQRQQAVT